MSGFEDDISAITALIFCGERPARMRSLGLWAARALAVAPPMPPLLTPVMRITLSVIEEEKVAATVEAVV